jgi:hypothetical protein
VVTDERDVAARRVCGAPLDGVAPGTPEYKSIREACRRAMRRAATSRAATGSSEDDPQAAREAVTGSRPLRDLVSVALLSNGASRIVSPYGVADWPGVLALLAAAGPAGVVDRVRTSEAGTAGAPETPVPDDATVVHCTDLAAGSR